MKLAHQIASLGEISGHYDGVLCDVWGVIHDGHAAHPAACAALRRFRRERGPVLLLSNAPRPGDSVVTLLDQLGVPRDAYDGILTSGDATRLEMQRRGDASFFHLGPTRDREVWAGLTAREARAEEASFILCTGLFDDERETPDTYRDLLAKSASHGLPMICANPDIKVSRGPKLIWCAGAVAAAYHALGGEVTYYGKPHPPIYDQALDQLDRLAGREVAPTRVLAIGDGLKTDILGANRAGIDALLITAGIHAADFGASHAPETTRVHASLEAHEVFAAAFQPQLVWAD
jgi:HAD superfamily hydrolase (TIGR01459 family)